MCIRDRGKNDSKAEITSYNDCDALLQALRDDGSYVSPYSAIDPDVYKRQPYNSNNTDWSPATYS